MKGSEGQVKVQADDDFGIRKVESQGPFAIEHGPAEKKPIFVAHTGDWTNFQNAKYAAYVLHNRNKIEGRPHNLLWGLFKDMAEFIGSRNFRQCKLRHQKLYQIQPSIQNIIKNFKTSIQNFDTLLEMEIKSYKRYENDKKPLPSYSELSPKSSPNLFEAQKLPSKQTLIETAPNYINEPQKMSPPPLVFHENAIPSTYQMFMPYQPAKSNVQQWLECHHLFLEWTRRLKQLSQCNFFYSV